MLIFLVMMVVCGAAWGQGVSAPPPATTPYSRGVLKAVDAAEARTALGIVATNVSVVAATGIDTGQLSTNASKLQLLVGGTLPAMNGAAVTNVATEYGILASAFGVVGDGGTDCTVALQNAINYCVNLGLSGGKSPVLILPKGTIKITSEIKIPPLGTNDTTKMQWGPANHLTIQGAGRGVSGIDATSITSGYALTALHGATNNPPSWYGFQLRDFSIYGPAITVSQSSTNSGPNVTSVLMRDDYTSTGFAMGAVGLTEWIPQQFHYVVLENFDVWGFKTNYYCAMTTTTQVRNSRFYFGTSSDIYAVNNDGMLLDTVAAGYIHHGSGLLNGGSNYLASVYISGGLGICAKNCEFVSSKQLLRISPGPGENSTVNIEATQFEPDAGDRYIPIAIYGSSSTVKFDGCTLNNWIGKTNDSAWFTGYDGGLDFFTLISGIVSPAPYVFREIDTTTDLYHRPPSVLSGSIAGASGSAQQTWNSDLNYVWENQGVTNLLSVPRIADIHRSFDGTLNSITRNEAPGLVLNPVLNASRIGKVQGQAQADGLEVGRSDGAYIQLFGGNQQGTYSAESGRLYLNAFDTKQVFIRSGSSTIGTFGTNGSAINGVNFANGSLAGMVYNNQRFINPGDCMTNIWAQPYEGFCYITNVLANPYPVVAWALVTNNTANFMAANAVPFRTAAPTIVTHWLSLPLTTNVLDIFYQTAADSNATFLLTNANSSASVAYISKTNVIDGAGSSLMTTSPGTWFFRRIYSYSVGAKTLYFLGAEVR